MPRTKSPATAASGQGQARNRRGAGPANQPRKKPNQRANRQMEPASRRLQPNFQGLPRYLKCVIDPFSMDPCGYPDNFNEPTHTTKLTDAFTMTTNVDGNAFLTLSPVLTNASFTHTVAASTRIVSAGVGADHPDLARVNSASVWSRTVCFGVRIDYIGAEMTCSGTIAVVKDYALNYGVGADIHTLINDGVSLPARDGRMIPMVPAQAPRYESNNDTAYMAPTFQYCTIIATGLPPSTNAIRVTVVRHVEILPSRTDVLLRESHKVVPAEPLTISGLSMVPANAQSTTANWGEATKQLASHAWAGMAHAAGPFVQAGVGKLTASLATTALALL